MEDKLPGGWASARLGELIPKPRPKIPPDPKSGLPFIGMDHIEPNSFQLVGQDEFAAMKSAGSYFKPGDVLYGRLRPYLNKVHRAKFEGVASAEFIVLPESEFCDGEFIKYLLHQKEFVDYAMSRSSGDRPRVKFNGLADFMFALPPLNEQRRIVEKIETLFARLDQGEADLRQVQTLLARYRQSILKAAVTGQLTSDWRAENANLFPKVINGMLGDFIKVQGGFAFKSKDFCERGIPLIRISNLTGSNVQLDDRTVFLPKTYAKEYERFLVKTGDVLIAMSGATTGKMGVFAGTEKVLLNQRVGRFLPREGISFDKSFLQFIIFGMRDQILREAYGGAQPNISPKKIEEMDVSVPNTTQEQAEIASRVAQEFSKCESIERLCTAELTRSTALRQSILKQAFAGRLVAQDPNDEPASELLARIRATAEEAPKQSKTRRKAKA